MSIPLESARCYANELLDRLRPACLEGYALAAGSIRRQINQVGDIDLVVVPRIEMKTRESRGQVALFGPPPEQVAHNLVWEICDELVGEGVLGPISAASTAREPIPDSGWASKWKGSDKDRSRAFKFLHAAGDVGVDLWMPDREAFPAILAIRTGSGEFAKELVTKFAIKTGQRGRFENGRLVYKGQPIEVVDERHLFAECGVAWIDPALRNGARDCRWLRRRAA